MRHAATFALGTLCGVLLALLLTSTATSRQASAPRPAPSEYRRLVSTERTEVPSAVSVTSPPRSAASELASGDARAAGSPLGTSATPTTSSGAASATAATDPVPTVAPTPKPTKRPRATTRPADGLSGTATWYSYRRGQAAAGPRLRAALGAGWRGETVLVNGVPVVLSDYMGTRNRDKVIDLDDGLFTRICGPLSMGVCEVEVRW